MQMSNEIIGKANEFSGKTKKPVAIYAMAVFTGFVLIASMFYNFQTGTRMASTYALQIKAIMEVEFEATRAHLWFEEFISGDKQEDMTQVWSLIERSQWYANALIDGAQNEEGVFVPLKDDNLRTSAINIKDQLADFKKITKQRHENPLESAIGSPIDQQYDQVYEQLINDTGLMVSKIERKINANLRIFRITQIVITVLCTSLIVIVTVVIVSFIQKQLNHEEQLRAANQQLQASEQQLRAANQQLQASEQQLKAGNQQLQASEQQLKAANQQLQAGEQQLRASNQQLEAKEKEYMLLFNEMTVGLAVHEIICDDKGKPCDYLFLDINPAFENLTGINREQVTGKTIRQIMPAIDDFWIDTYGNVALTGTPTRFEHYAKELQKHFDVAAYMPKNGQFAVVFTDVTDRKNTEKQLELLNRAISQRNKELQSIVYISSHDLRSPLVNVQGFGGELRMHCDNLRKLINNVNVEGDLKEEITCLIDSDIPESLQFISAGTKKMQTLLDGLLSVSRIGTIEFDMQQIDMNSLVDTVITTMQFQIDEIEASVTVEKLPDCIGDFNQINQVFSNLINNAIKYFDFDRKGKIVISGKTENGNTIYAVQDNGMGIDPQHQEKIFEVFHRLNPKTSPPGEGLGLTIISRILDRHNGRIWVDSKPQEGSTFFVSLPNA